MPKWKLLEKSPSVKATWKWLIDFLLVTPKEQHFIEYSLCLCVFKTMWN